MEEDMSLFPEEELNDGPILDNIYEGSLTNNFQQQGRRQMMYFVVAL